MWAHLLHETVVAAPTLHLLAEPRATDASLRAGALALLEALLGLPVEYVLLQELSWAHPLCGVAYAVAQKCERFYGTT